jgi:hypothetical protein
VRYAHYCPVQAGSVGSAQVRQVTLTCAEYGVHPVTGSAANKTEGRCPPGEQLLNGESAGRNDRQGGAGAWESHTERLVAVSEPSAPVTLAST